MNSKTQEPEEHWALILRVQTSQGRREVCIATNAQNLTPPSSILEAIGSALRMKAACDGNHAQHE